MPVRRASHRGVACAAILVATVAGTLTLPARVLAQAPSLSFSWEASFDECPDEGRVRSAIDQLLAGGPLPARVEARAVVQRLGGDHWRVQLTTLRDGATGQRVVDAGSCSSLADATELIVALTVDPERVAANRPVASATGSASVAATGSPAVPVPVAGTAPAPGAATGAATATGTETGTETETESAPSRARPRPHLAILAEFLADSGTLPATAPGGSLAVAWMTGRYRLEGYGAFWPNQQGHAQNDPALAGEIQLIAGGVRGCYLLLDGLVDAGICPGLELGVLHGQGLDVSSPQPADGIWFAATATARLSLQLVPPFGLAVDVGGVLPFERDVFTLDQLGPIPQASTIHQAGLVEGRAGVGLEARFF